MGGGRRWHPFITLLLLEFSTRGWLISQLPFFFLRKDFNVVSPFPLFLTPREVVIMAMRD